VTSSLPPVQYTVNGGPPSHVHGGCIVPTKVPSTSSSGFHSGGIAGGSLHATPKATSANHLIARSYRGMCASIHARMRPLEFLQKVVKYRRELRTMVPAMVMGRISAATFAARNLAGRSDTWVRTGRARQARAFNRLFYYLRRNTFDSTFFLGKHVLKFPTDLWAYQELIHERKPDVIVETGVFLGGSTYYFAKLLEWTGGGRVIGVDITLDHADPELASMKNVTLIEGNTTSPETLERVRKLIRPGERVMVVLDSDHTTEHVAAEMELFSTLVTEGQYLVVEDGIVEDVYPMFLRNGPRKAVKKFLTKARGFAPEYYWNRFLLSLSPAGFLLKTDGREKVRFSRPEDCYRPLNLWVPYNPAPGKPAWTSMLDQNKDSGYQSPDRTKSEPSAR
jgi:cephalosporin hydroxylase